MAQQTKCTCDRCGADITRKSIWTVLKLRPRGFTKRIHFGHGSYDYHDWQCDLCKECDKALSKWLQQTAKE